MGRPLNKKFFGNRNIGSISTTADDGIGGQGVASFAISGTNDNYATKPTVSSIDAPDLVDGVQATAGTITMTAKTALVSTIGTGDVNADYAVDDVLTVSGGTFSTAATFTVSTVKVRTLSVENAGTTVWVDGDTITFSSGWDTPTVIQLAVTTGSITGFTIVNAGVYSGPAITGTLTPDSSSNAGFVTDCTFNLGFGINTVTVLSGGAYTALPSNAASTTTDSSTGGTGATLNVRYGVQSIEVVEQGSGYSTAPALTLSGGNAVVTGVLTTNSGVVGSAGNQEPAIIAYAFIGGSRQIVDIVSQDSSRRYTVRTASASLHSVLLVPYESAQVGEMDITAIDASSNEYWVAKLTAHKALLTRKVSGSGLFATGISAPWTLTGPASGYVKIENA